MAAQIRPNRLDVNDRFPMLGFTIRTDGAPQRAEVVIATDWSLLRADARARRTSSNFYSSRAGGPLNIPRGEAVFVVPPEVLARFVGAEKLYFGLAVAPAGDTNGYGVAVLPTAASPYVSLRELTDRSLRRVRILPNRQQRAAGYGDPAQGSLEWAGDAAVPGAVPAAPANGMPPAAATPAQPAAPAPYDDGFGPLPPAAPPNAAVPPAPVPTATAPAAAPPTAPPPNGAPPAPAQGLARAFDAGGSGTEMALRRRAAGAQGLAARAFDSPDPPQVQIAPEGVPITSPETHLLSAGQRAAILAGLNLLPAPIGPFVAALPAAARAAGVSIGVGPAVAAGFMSGAGLGVGLIFGKNGELGAYGSAELDVGFLSSLSATLQMTVVGGGIEAFNGWSNAYGVSGGEEFVGGAAAIFDEKGAFCGVTVQAGVGAGLWPVDLYVAAQKSRAVQLALAQAAASQSRAGRRGQVWSKALTARALGDDPLAVDIKYRMFIPSPLIDSPFTVFGGDGRSFSYGDGTSRGEIHATARLTAEGGVEGVDIIDRRWGESTAYATSDSYHPEGKPDWWLEKVEGAEPTERKTLAVSDDNLNIIVGASTRRSLQTMLENASVVTIAAAGALPLSMTAPDIDATMSVFLRINGASVEAKVDGSHDGFPCHELYVNGQRLYAYDPVAAGNSPTSLMPPEDIEAVTDWVTVATLGAAQSLAARAFEAPMLPNLEFASIAWNAAPPNQLNGEGAESLSQDQKLARWKGLLEALVGPQTAALLRDLPAVARDRGWTIAVGAGATPGVALGSSIGSGLAIDPDSQPYSFGIGRLDGGPPADPFEPPQMAQVNDGRPQITILSGGSESLLRFGLAVGFRAQDKRVGNGAVLLTPDGAFAGVSFGLEVNGLKAEDVFDAVAVGYGQSPAKFGTFSKPAAQALSHPRRPLLRGLADEPPAPGTKLARTQKEQGGVRFDLVQLGGLIPPQTVTQTAVGAPLPGRRIVLNDWPYLDGQGGRTHGDVSIDWAYAAGSVGDIFTDVAAAEAYDGIALSVTTDILPAVQIDPTVAAVTVRARYVFGRAGQPDEVAVTEVTLFGDGREPTRNSRQEQQAPPVAPPSAAPPVTPVDAH